jgi:3-phytase
MKHYKTIALSLIAMSVAGSFSLKAQNSILSVTPVLETRSHFDDAEGNFTDVDDPAIWIHPSNKAKSIVVTTLKQGGLDIYDLAGKLIQHVPPAPAPTCADTQLKCENKGGRFNNADIIYDFKLNGKNTDIVVVSDRGLDKLAIYSIAADAKSTHLVDVTAANNPLIFSTNQSEINEGLTAYGLSTVKTDKSMAFVSQNSTTVIEQLELFDDGKGKINYRSIATINFPSMFTLPNGKVWTPCTNDDDQYPQFEGMVADTTHGFLYLAQEDVGIWKADLTRPANSQEWQLFVKVKKYGVPYSRTWDAAEEEYVCKIDFTQDPGFGSDNLLADVEGLTIYDGGNGKGYLLASSQGDNTVAVYDREGDNQFVNSFTVADGEIDGVNETDGMMVVNVNLGGKFDQGLLVMQDGKNLTPEASADNERENSNFKYVAWRDIAEKLKLPVNDQDRTRQ